MPAEIFLQTAPQRDVRAGLCKLCGSYCPISVTVEDGRAISVTGDREAPLYEGYTCPKGRALPDHHYGPSRLLHSMKRDADGIYRPIGSERAMDEIAARVSEIIGRHGPRSVALYWGTGLCTFPQNVSIAAAWMESIGSPMIFGATAIDKPGAPIAQALHGHWPPGHPPFEEAEAWILIGLNPLVSRSGGFPPNNPGLRLKEAVAQRGMKLIVIDPRVTESSARAHLHLQPRPGCDPVILAAMIHVILAEALHDQAFVADNVEGLDALRTAVLPFTPAVAAAMADVDGDEIIEAARIFARSRYAGIGTGIGPSFSLTGTLTDYLATSLMSLCGFWSREGDRVVKPNVLLPAYAPRAEAMPPFPAWGFGERLRSRNLGYSVAGMPTGGLADEILTKEEGGIKALFCMAGNPMMAWPDQHRALAALESLDLLVTAELEMSATARLSDYVIAPKLSLEMPGTSALVEGAKYYGHNRGIEGAYARYAPAIVAPPPGSDVIGDWELYYGLARRMGLGLVMKTAFGIGRHAEAETQEDVLDMAQKPSDDDLIALSCRNSRIPLDVVKRHPHGHMFDDIDLRVGPRSEASTSRLDVGNPAMMLDLAKFLAPAARQETPAFLLLPRRTNRMMNSSGRLNARLGGLEPTNPAFLHPDDLDLLGLRPGDQIRISTRHGSVIALAESDPGLRRGCLSITHGFGGNPGEAEDPASVGCNVGRLLSADTEFDPVSGIPRMGAVPITITRIR